MTQPLTSEQARELLREQPDGYRTSAQLRELAAQVDADAPGRLTVLYSGPAAKNIWSTDVITAMVDAGEDVRVINKSEAAKFLESREFYNALADAYDVDVDKLVDGSYRGPATEWLYHPTEGPWADASGRFADATHGEVRAIVHDANPSRVFGAVEVPHILANPNVTVVEGLPREALAGLSQREGQQAAFDLIVSRAREHASDLRVPLSDDVLRTENRVLRLDSRDYLAETGIDGQQPRFTEPTHRLAERMNPPTEHAQAGQARWAEWHTTGPQALSEPFFPNLSRAGTTAGLAGLGVAAAAYDAKQTGDRIGTAFAQDNPAGAQSEATHYVARGVGGAAAMFTPAAVGVSGGPALALVVADGYLLTKAFDRGAQFLDVRKITHQTDRDGVGWEFNGKQWIRDDLKADLRDDGVDQVHRQSFAAQPDKARELSQLASAEAVGQAIHKAHPENPFVQPANEHDPAHLHHRDWTRSPETGAWSRSVADEVDRNDAPVWKAQPEYASPARAAELDRQAAQVIDRNLTEGPAALAARYEIAHRRNGWDSFGPEPDVVRTALNPDALQASDQRQYVRDAQGQWSHDGEPARGNTAVELEATRERLLPALAQHQEALARIEPWQPPTPEQQDRTNLRQLYTDNGVNPNPDRFEAAYQAVRETREAQGITPAATSLALEPRPAGGYDINTPIQHLQIEGDGVVRVAAMTTAADIQRTEAALKGAPHAIEAPSAQAREEQAQAQREANRAGLSQDDAQATVRSAVPTVATPGGRSGKTDDVEPAAKEEAKPERTGAMLLDNPAHQNHAMFAALLRTVNERDKELGREPDDISRQLAGGLVEKARERGLETIGAAKFTPDGTKVGMTDTADLSAPWAKTAVGDVGQLAGQKLEQSSEKVAAINQKQALEQSLQPPPPTQGLDGPDGPAPKGPRLV